MFRNRTFACVIPARGGSKGLVRKNIREICGKPMLAHVIDAARKSGIFEIIAVTSDDDEILDVARQYNAEVIKRPDELATDDALVEDVLAHACKNIAYCEFLLLLEPTSPLIEGADILKAAIQLLNDDAEMIISVVKASPDMVTIGRLGKDRSMKGFLPKDLRVCPRQKRPEYYYLNSGIYMGKWDIFAKKKDFYEQDTVAFIMNPDDNIHIDTMEDFIKAETILKTRERLRSAFCVGQPV